MTTIRPPGTRIGYADLVVALKDLIANYDQALAGLNNTLDMGVDEIKQVSASLMEPRRYKGTAVQRESQRGYQIRNNNGLEKSLSQMYLV